MLRSSLRKWFYVLTVTLSFSLLAAASDKPDRFQMGRDIRVEPGDKTGDISCLNCSVYIRGLVSGDVFTMHGNVVIENGGSVSGDVSTLMGDVRMESGATIGGEVATIVGAVHRQPQALIAGEVSSMDGPAWLLLIVFVPLVILAAIIALIIWLVQRNRRPATAMA